MNIHEYTWIYMNILEYTCEYTWIYMNMLEYACICLNVHEYTCEYAWICMDIHEYTCIYMNIHHVFTGPEGKANAVMLLDRRVRGGKTGHGSHWRVYSRGPRRMTQWSPLRCCMAWRDTPGTTWENMISGIFWAVRPGTTDRTTGRPTHHRRRLER
jgi:hypothetical protein